jgi:hypothetical protein
MWVYTAGPLVGGALAGFKKHFDARLKVKLEQTELHPVASQEADKVI